MPRKPGQDGKNLQLVSCIARASASLFQANNDEDEQQMNLRPEVAAPREEGGRGGRRIGSGRILSREGEGGAYRGERFERGGGGGGRDYYDRYQASAKVA